MEAAEAFGAILRARRLGANLTQEHLALDAHIQRVHVSKLERGLAQPTLAMLLTLAKAFGCPASDLVADVERYIASAHRKSKPGAKSTPRRARAKAKPSR